MVNNVLFDLDGTLLDTSRGILESIQHTIHVMGLRALTEEELLSFIGPPLRRSFKETCGCTEEESRRATTVFRTHYQAGAVLHAALYDGMLETCKTLERHGVRMGVATNKPQRFADALMKEFGLDALCRPVCGADESGNLSKADLIRLCMEQMGASPEQTVLVGDTDNDAEGAAQAGVGFLAVTYGFGFKTAADLKGIPCIGVADKPAQIADLIAQNRNGWC